MPCHCTTRSFNLARSDALRLSGLQAVGAKVQIRSALGFAMNPPFMHFAELCAFWLQHGLLLPSADRRHHEVLDRLAVLVLCDRGLADHAP